MKFSKYLGYTLLDELNIMVESMLHKITEKLAKGAWQSWVFCPQFEVSFDYFHTFCIIPSFPCPTKVGICGCMLPGDSHVYGTYVSACTYFVIKMLLKYPSFVLPLNQEWKLASLYPVSLYNQKLSSEIFWGDKHMIQLHKCGAF